MTLVFFLEERSAQEFLNTLLPSDELRRLVPSYQKVNGARRVAAHMDIGANTSQSFQVFAKAVRKLVEEVIGS